MFGVAKTQEAWIRVIGVVAGVLGTYYVAAGRGEWIEFIRSSVWGRGIVLPSLAALVVLASAPSMVLIFGTIDSLGAL